MATSLPEKLNFNMEMGFHSKTALLMMLHDAFKALSKAQAKESFVGEGGNRYCFSVDEPLPKAGRKTGTEPGGLVINMRASLETILERLKDLRALIKAQAFGQSFSRHQVYEDFSGSFWIIWEDDSPLSE